jgi:hypothetical protein
VASASKYQKDTTSHQWINPAAFVPNTGGTFGPASANSLVGPHFFNVDANLSKLFTTYREPSLQLRFEFFNLFNHTNYGLPVDTLSSGTFGQIQVGANSGRIIQLGAKYNF